MSAGVVGTLLLGGGRGSRSSQKDPRGIVGRVEGWEGGSKCGFSALSLPPWAEPSPLCWRWKGQAAAFSQKWDFLTSISCRLTTCGWSSIAHRASTAHPKRWGPHFTPESAAPGRRGLPGTLSASLEKEFPASLSQISSERRGLPTPSHRASCTLTFPDQILLWGGWGGSAPLPVSSEPLPEPTRALRELERDFE